MTEMRKFCNVFSGNLGYMLSSYSAIVCVGGKTRQFTPLELELKNNIKKTRGNKIFRLWKSCDLVMMKIF